MQSSLRSSVGFVFSRISTSLDTSTPFSLLNEQRSSQVFFVTIDKRVWNLCLSIQRFISLNNSVVKRCLELVSIQTFIVYEQCLEQTACCVEERVIPLKYLQNTIVTYPWLEIVFGPYKICPRLIQGGLFWKAPSQNPQNLLKRSSQGLFTSKTTTYIQLASVGECGARRLSAGMAFSRL